MTQDITPASILSLIGTDKQERERFAQYAIQQAIDGTRDPLMMHLQLKAMEDIIKRITSDDAYRNACIDEAAKYDSRNAFEFHNAKLQLREVGIKWDYSNTGDSFLVELNEQIDRLTEAKKAREKFLQAIPASGIANPETGEIVYPATKTSTTSVVVTLK